MHLGLEVAFVHLLINVLLSRATILLSETETLHDGFAKLSLSLSSLSSSLEYLSGDFSVEVQ